MALVYDYYSVAVPGDLADNLKALSYAAIDEARERTRLYCVPAEWTATRIKGNIGDRKVTFRVRRRRNRTDKGANT